MNDSLKKMSESAQRYADAYEAHYKFRDLLGALRSYGEILDHAPDSAEGGYARAQVRNIVNVVVPSEELLTSHRRLAARQLLRAAEDARVAAAAAS